MRRGQTLIVVLLCLIALLAIVGLTLDGGRVYWTRRALQNASDAAALAGAQELAINKRTTTQAAIWSKVSQYLQANNVDPKGCRAFLVQGSQQLLEITNSTSSSSPPAFANGVEVIANRTITVLFGGFLGQSQDTVSARARANFGNLKTLPARNNVVPIGVHYEIVRDASFGDSLTLWDGYQVSLTSPSGSSSSYGDASDPYSGWLNLLWIHNSEDESREIDLSHSQANVNDWLLNGSPQAVIAGSLGGIDGDFVMGDPGIRASGLQRLEDKSRELINQGQPPIFYFIIFDRYFDRNSMRNLFPSHSDFPNAYYFHAIGFTAIEVTEVRWQGKNKYVRGNFVSFIQSGDLNDGSFFSGDDEMVKVVALTE